MTRSMIFLLTRPSRDVTGAIDVHYEVKTISTHTPLAGRDAGPQTKKKRRNDFYSHAPRGT